MGTKAEETAHDATGCLSKAAPDEPIFVLRAQDELAPTAVRIWVQLAKRENVPEAKLDEAMSLADWMEDWQANHSHKVPD